MQADKLRQWLADRWLSLLFWIVARLGDLQQYLMDIALGTPHRTKKRKGVKRKRQGRAKAQNNGVTVGHALERV